MGAFKCIKIAAVSTMFWWGFVILSICTSSVNSANPNNYAGQINSKLAAEKALDEADFFWSRMAQEVASIVTDSPSKSPTDSPTKPPTKSPSNPPTPSPSSPPTDRTGNPTESPTKFPTRNPSSPPSPSPSSRPSPSPSAFPSASPSAPPTGQCTVAVGNTKAIIGFFLFEMLMVWWKY